MTTQRSILELVSARKGHFLLESGYHGALWLDLDGLFANPAAIAPHVDSLARRLSSHRPSVVCGPLVGGAFLAQLVARELGIEFSYTEKLAADAGGLFQTAYSLPAAFRERMRGRRVVLVDDVMSAGSSLRASLKAVLQYGSLPVAVGALLVLGETGEDFFRGRSIPVETDERRPYQTWEAAQCPQCAARVPLEATA
jgi:orotate phosphoribosyltransferase